MFILCSNLAGGHKMAMIETASPEDRAVDGYQAKLSAVYALVQLVDGPAPGQPDPVKDARAWVHTAFHTYRRGMGDNDATLPHLARIEYDFIAALVALNFDDQRRQLRSALTAIRSFHRAYG
jgi:hypothetical protein